MTNTPVPTTEPATNHPFAQWLHKSRTTYPMTQAELAQRSGLSNKSISEFERGEFGRTARLSDLAVARLAIALEKEPEEALKVAGLPITSAVVELAQRKVQNRQGQIAEVPSQQRSSVNSLAELRNMKHGTVRVSYIKDVSYMNFDQEHIRLLCKLINHRWDCEFVECETFRQKADYLAKDDADRCHVAIGAMETLERTASGLRFIPYPGLEHRLNAVVDVGSGSRAWQEIIARDKQILVITISNEVGDQYIRGVAGYREKDNNIISVPSYNIEKLTETFWQHSTTRSTGKVVLVAAEHVCCQVMNRSGVNARLVELAIDPDKREDDRLWDLPRYKPGILVRADDHEWYELLKKAQEFAFQTAPTQLARHYAQLLASLQIRKRPINQTPEALVGSQELARGFSFAQLHDLGSVASREYFIIQLEEALEKQLDKYFKLDKNYKKKYIKESILVLARRNFPLKNLVEDIKHLLTALHDQNKTLQADINDVKKTTAELFNMLSHLSTTDKNT